MPSSEAAPVRTACIGSGWISEQHVHALRAAPETEVVALADFPRDRGGRPGTGVGVCERLGISRYYVDYRELLAEADVEMVVIGLPNAVHAQVAKDSLQAGKHIVVEKPLCLSLDDADELVALAEAKGLVAGYAEELCFCPKFVRGKEIVDDGGIGEILFLEQIELHDGPYSDWFFDPALAGGGAVMDLGCHAIEYARWMLGKPKVVAVTAQLSTWVHGARGPVDDHCLVHLEFETGAKASLQAGWTQKGGMSSVARIQGRTGVLSIDLLQQSGLLVYSEAGAKNADVFPGWQRPGYEWLWSNGYPQEMSAFANAVRRGTDPVETIADGRAVLEIMWAAYASAAEGRTIRLPYAPPPGVGTPVELWLNRAAP